MIRDIRDREIRSGTLITITIVTPDFQHHDGRWLNLPTSPDRGGLQASDQGEGVKQLHVTGVIISLAPNSHAPTATSYYLYFFSCSCPQDLVASEVVQVQRHDGEGNHKDRHEP